MTIPVLIDELSNSCELHKYYSQLILTDERILNERGQICIVLVLFAVAVAIHVNRCACMAIGVLASSLSLHAFMIRSAWIREYGCRVAFIGSRRTGIRSRRLGAPQHAGAPTPDKKNRGEMRAFAITALPPLWQNRHVSVAFAVKSAHSGFKGDGGLPGRCAP